MRCAAPLLIVALSFAWCVRPMWDIDVWWHVATGRLILAGGMPSTDVFSAAHPDAPWTTFQWGYEAGVAWIDGVFGLLGLRLVHAAAIAAGAGVLAWRSRQPWVIAAVFMLMFEDRVRERPHVIEPLFVALMLPLLRRERPGAAALGALFLAPIWANLHAVSALWWVALAGAAAVGARTREAVGVLVLGVLAILASPGALAGLTAALHSHAAWPVALVPELSPTWRYVDLGGWGVVMLLGVGVGGLAAISLWRTDAPLAERLAAVGCAIAAAALIRWAWLATIPVLLLLDHRPVRGAWAALVVAPLLLHVGPRWTLAERAANVQAGRFPEAAVEFLADAGLRLPTDTMPEWTGYLLYRLHPPTTVLADGRMVFGDDVADLLLRRAASDAGSFDAAVGRFHTQVLVWRRGGLPPMEPTRWRQVYADEVAEVWLPEPAWTPARNEAINLARSARGLPPLDP